MPAFGQHWDALCQRWAHWYGVVPMLPVGQARIYLVIALIANMFWQQPFVDPGQGWEAMNKVYNVSLEAKGLPTNNTHIM